MSRFLLPIQVLFAMLAAMAGGLPVLAQTARVPAELAAPSQPVVTDVRFGLHEALTRLVLNVSDGVDYKVFTLADPHRLIVDLPQVRWDLPPLRTIPPGAAIKGFRTQAGRPGRSRLVLDLSQPVKVENALLVPPQGERRFRLVLDLKAIEETDFRKTAGWPEGEKPGTTVAETPQSTRKGRKIKICIDPGHGGIDPGAQGPKGTLEKDIVLDVAKKLKDMLIKTKRYEVSMTRDEDVFLSLKARVAAARGAKADLMISLHADAAGAASLANVLRGATVYTLSEKASDKEAEELAKSENQADVIAGVDLTKEPDEVDNILIDLAMRETKNKSVRFARLLVPQLQHTGRMVPKSHKFAGFRVLKAPDVPSVLVEMGYLTNADDELQMRSAGWRHQLAQSIVKAVEQYFAAERGTAKAL